jgi:hypothetical protein
MSAAFCLLGPRVSTRNMEAIHLHLHIQFHVSHLLQLTFYNFIRVTYFNMLYITYSGQSS